MDFAEQTYSFVLQWIEAFRQQDIMMDPILLLLLVGVITLWLGCACWSSSIAETRGYGAKPHFFIGLLLPIIYPPITLMGLDVKKSGRSAKKPKKKSEDTQKTQPVKKRRKKHSENEPASTENHQQTDNSQPEEKQNTPEGNVPEAPDLIVPEDEPPKTRPAKTGPGLRPMRKTSSPPGESTPDDAADSPPREFNKPVFKQMAEQAENSGVRFRIRYAGGREVTALEIVEATAQYAVVSVESDEGSSQRVRIPYARVETVEPVE